MATAPQVQTAGTLSSEGDYSRWLDWNARPTDEARSLFKLVGRNGDTVESVRELIAVPPETERNLRSFICQHPEDALGVERVLQYRRRVAQEFERLCRRKNRSHRVVAKRRIILPQVLVDGSAVRVAEVASDRTRPLSLFPDAHGNFLAVRDFRQ
jgi:hypothetical protein